MQRWCVVLVVLLACSGDEDNGPGASASSGAAAGGAGPGASVAMASSSVGQGGGGNPNERRVFVTSAVYSGALGGIPGADEKCQALAGALGGSWRAWVGDGDSSPAQNFTQSAVPYVLVGGDV